MNRIKKATRRLNALAFEMNTKAINELFELLRDEYPEQESDLYRTLAKARHATMRHKYQTQPDSIKTAMRLIGLMNMCRFGDVDNFIKAIS